MRLEGSTILITGASRGIGRHLAVHFAPTASLIIVTARTEAGLRETAGMVEGAGGRCIVCVSDLGRLDTLECLAKEVRCKADRLDVLINNAADVTSKPFLDTTCEEIAGLIRANVTGCLQLCRLVAPIMMEQGGGTIVNISSLAGYKPNPAQTVYSVSKAAVNAIAEALRSDLGSKGIRLMNVALASVAAEGPPAEGPPKPGQVPVAEFAKRLEEAIRRDETELFLSPLTKWLMRLYRFYPPLARLR